MVEIDSRFTNTIKDYLYLKEDADGTKKEKAKDALTGVTYEKYGHTSDANDYLLCEAFTKEFDKYQGFGKSNLKNMIGFFK
jgi:phage terminase large subunit